MSGPAEDQKNDPEDRFARFIKSLDFRDSLLTIVRRVIASVSAPKLSPDQKQRVFGQFRFFVEWGRSPELLGDAEKAFLEGLPNRDVDPNGWKIELLRRLVEREAKDLIQFDDQKVNQLILQLVEHLDFMGQR